MNRKLLLTSLCTALFLVTTPGTVSAAPAGQAAASIPFASSGSIYDWRAEGDRTLYIEDIHHNWYKATLFGFVPDLDFSETIGFVPEASGEFNKFSAVIVRGQEYPVRTFVKVQAPPASAKKSHKNMHEKGPVKAPAATGAATR